MIIGFVFAILLACSLMMGAWGRPARGAAKHYAVRSLFVVMALLGAAPAMSILAIDWGTGGTVVWHHFDAIRFAFTVDPTFGSTPAGAMPTVALPIWYPLTFLIPPLLGLGLGKYVEGKVDKLVVRDGA